MLLCSQWVLDPPYLLNDVSLDSLIGQGVPKTWTLRHQQVVSHKGEGEPSVVGRGEKIVMETELSKFNGRQERRQATRLAQPASTRNRTLGSVEIHRD